LEEGFKWTLGKDDIARSRANLRRPYEVYSSLDGGHSAPKADGERQDTAGKPSSRPPIFYAESFSTIVGLARGYPTLPFAEKPRIPAQDYVTRDRTAYWPLLNLFQAVHRTNDRAFCQRNKRYGKSSPYTAHMSGVQMQNLSHPASASGMQWITYLLSHFYQRKASGKSVKLSRC
jgi:hypothetical protein